MKKILFVSAMLLLAASVAFAASWDGPGTYTQTYTPGKGILTTPHDLSGAYGEKVAPDAGSTAGNWGDEIEQAGLNRVCIYCHAPHHTVKPGSDAANGLEYLPLWNHDVTSNAGFYTPYSAGSDLPDEDGNHESTTSELVDNQPGSVSVLCLSCHDGNVAVNAYGTDQTRSTGSLRGTPKSFSATMWMAIGAGGDLSNHHPVGFVYDNVTDDEIADSSWAMTTTGGTTPTTINTIGDLLYTGKMECVTCHDVHNTKNTGEKFLWKSDKGSELCLTCHLKGTQMKNTDGTSGTR